MKVLVAHLYPWHFSTGSMMASTRIANYLVEHFNATLMTGVDTDIVMDRWDLVIYVNCPLFSDIKIANAHWHFSFIAQKAKRFIFVNNDYSLPIKSCLFYVSKYLELEKPEAIAWSTVNRLVDRSSELSSYVNWNLLTYEPIEPVENPKQRILYYGALRQDRIEMFKKYLFSPMLPVDISCSKALQKKFKAIAPNANTIDKFPSLIDNIKHWAATVYLEDRYSTRNYCSPANRFYEALSAGICQFFSEESIGTMERAGYDVTPYVVRSADDLYSKLPHAKEFAAEQAKLWRRDYLAELRTQVFNAFDKIKNKIGG